MSNKNYLRNYYQKYKKSIIDSIKKNQKEKYNKDILFNLKQRLQTRLDNEIGNVDIEDILGCSLSFFKKYIKYLLRKKNLTYDSEYHLDHIIPINSYDDKIKGFHWMNIQILLPSKNLSKKDDRDYDTEENHKKLLKEFLFNLHQFK